MKEIWFSVVVIANTTYAAIYIQARTYDIQTGSYVRMFILIYTYVHISSLSLRRTPYAQIGHESGANGENRALIGHQSGKFGTRIGHKKSGTK